MRARTLLILVLMAMLCGAACRGREQTPASQPTQPSVIQPPVPPAQPPAGKPTTQPQPAQPQPAGTASPTPPARPDLIIAETTVTPTAANSNQVRIHIVARNQGGPLSAAFTIRWHPHQKDKGLVGCSQDFNTLNQREWVVDCTYTYPAGEGGEMHWFAIVDAANNVLETNENNNERTGTVTVAASGGRTPTAGGRIPVAPSDLEITPSSRAKAAVVGYPPPLTTTLDLTWKDNSNNEDGFEIAVEGVKDPTTGPNITKYEVTIKCGVSYNFRVRAFNTAGKSEYSNAVPFTWIACPGEKTPTVPIETVVKPYTQRGQTPTVGVGGAIPAAPSDLQIDLYSLSKDLLDDSTSHPRDPFATPVYKTTFELTLIWKDNSNNEDGFEIAVEGVKDPTTGPNCTRYTLLLKCGVSYNFKVRAFNAAGKSEYSNAVPFTRTVCP